jgi:hypothetical protein
MPVEDLGRVDVVRMNLLCAAELPGAESLDLEGSLGQLDRWAECVRHETERHLYRLGDPRYASFYHGSEPYFRASFLLQVLAPGWVPRPPGIAALNLGESLAAWTTNR